MSSSFSQSFFTAEPRVGIGIRVGIGVGVGLLLAWHVIVGIAFVKRFSVLNSWRSAAIKKHLAAGAWSPAWACWARLQQAESSRELGSCSWLGDWRSDWTALCYRPTNRPTAVRGTCLVVYIRYEATISGALRDAFEQRAAAAAAAAAEIVVNTNMAKISATSWHSLIIGKWHSFALWIYRIYGQRHSMELWLLEEPPVLEGRAELLWNYEASICKLQEPRQRLSTAATIVSSLLIDTARAGTCFMWRRQHEHRLKHLHSEYNKHIYPYSMFVSSAAISRVKFNTRMWVHCPNGALTPLTRFTRRRRHRKSTLVNAWICLLEKFLFFLAIALFALGFILSYCIAPFCFFLFLFFFFTVLRLSELLFSGTLQGILWFIFCDL